MAKLITMNVIYSGGSGLTRKEGLQLCHVVRWWPSGELMTDIELSTGSVICVAHSFKTVNAVLDAARLEVTAEEYMLATKMREL